MVFNIFKKQTKDEIKNNRVDYIPKNCPIEITIPENRNCSNRVITNATFDDIDDISSGFANSILFNVIFEECNLNKVNFINAYFINCNFINCMISGTCFMNCHMINTTFEKCCGCAYCANVVT